MESIDIFKVNRAHHPLIVFLQTNPRSKPGLVAQQLMMDNETDNVPFGAVVEGNPAPHVSWAFQK